MPYGSVLLGWSMKKDTSGESLRKGIASMIEQYIDSMEISSEKMDKIVQMAAEIYGQIKATGNAPDGESLALTLYLVANQAAEKKPHDPYEFAGYA